VQNWDQTIRKPTRGFNDGEKSFIILTAGGDDGNYIMFARATSGDKKNNRNFSPCSLKSIKPVLMAKARGPKGCFKGKQIY
jgi:hypothetical protein